MCFIIDLCIQPLYLFYMLKRPLTKWTNENKAYVKVYICSQAQRFLLAYIFRTKNTYNERYILDSVPRLLIPGRIVEIHRRRLKKDGFLITVEF